MNIKKVSTRKAWSNKDSKQLIRLYLIFQSYVNSGTVYSKALPVRLLAAKQGRTKGSIESKLMNVSGVLALHGLDWVPGYKPLINFNHDLFEQVKKQIDLPDYGDIDILRKKWRESHASI